MENEFIILYFKGINFETARRGKSSKGNQFSTLTRTPFFFFFTFLFFISLFFFLLNRFENNNKSSIHIRGTKKGKEGEGGEKEVNPVHEGTPPKGKKERKQS